MRQNKAKIMVLDMVRLKNKIAHRIVSTRTRVRKRKAREEAEERVGLNKRKVQA